MRVAERLGAEVADARVDVHAAVRLDDEQTVEAGRPGDERADRDAEPRTFVPFRLPLRAFRSSQLNSSAPLSSASFTNALVA